MARSKEFKPVPPLKGAKRTSAFLFEKFLSEKEKKKKEKDKTQKLKDRIFKL